MLFHFMRILPVRWRFGSYKPRAVTFRGIARWYFQFPSTHRSSLAALLKYVNFLDEKTVRKKLVELNEDLARRLNEGGIDPKHTIYIQMHDAGSSSSVMLNMLRDAAQLEKNGSPLVDWQNETNITKLTNNLQYGAVVYVDDFAGSGTQFCDVRDIVSQQLVGREFAEFALMPCVCEEALEKMRERGVECMAGMIHRKAERPLHPESTLLKPSDKSKLMELSDMVHPRYGLGFRHLATMVVFYSNSPDSTPLVLRGNEGQSPFVGVLPRTTDL